MHGVAGGGPSEFSIFPRPRSHSQSVRICYAHRFGGQRVSTHSMSSQSHVDSQSVYRKSSIIKSPPFVGVGGYVCTYVQGCVEVRIATKVAP